MGRKSTEHQVSDATKPTTRVARLGRLIVIVIILVMAVDLVLIIREAQWFNAFLILTIMSLIIASLIYGERISVQIPAEFHVSALVFVFAALFLGEVRSYYDKIWWWDVALHGSSGLLLGVFGFLLVYMLNESKRIDLELTHRFVALFAFLFAVATGALWEILEFAADRLFDTRMQKPMFDDPSGLTDTMWDLILDAVGALIVSVLGLWRMSRGQHAFFDDWVEKFGKRKAATRN